MRVPRRSILISPRGLATRPELSSECFDFGGDAADTLRGRNNADNLYGGDNNDLLDGQDGNDYLEGDDGIDTLMGGTGKDILRGGTANDILNGGADLDTYVINAGDGSDTIIDSGPSRLKRNGRLFTGLFERNPGTGTYRFVGKSDDDGKDVIIQINSPAKFDFGNGGRRYFPGFHDRATS